MAAARTVRSVGRLGGDEGVILGGDVVRPVAARGVPAAHRRFEELAIGVDVGQPVLRQCARPAARIPKGATGKLQRLGLAERLGLTS